MWISMQSSNCASASNWKELRIETFGVFDDAYINVFIIHLILNRFKLSKFFFSPECLYSWWTKRPFECKLELITSSRELHPINMYIFPSLKAYVLVFVFSGSICICIWCSNHNYLIEDNIFFRNGNIGKGLYLSLNKEKIYFNGCSMNIKIKIPTIICLHKQTFFICID